MRDRRVVVIGLGQVGLSVLRLLGRHEERLGLALFGVDPNPEARAAAKKQTPSAVIGEAFREEYKPDVISICVPCDETGEPLDTVIREIFGWVQGTAPAKFTGWAGRLWSIESTLPSVRYVADLRGKHDMLRSEEIVVFPHRIAPNEPGHDEADSDVRLLGGITREATRRGIGFWGPIIGYGKIRFCSAEEAAFCKIAENAHRFVEIALAEEIELAAWGQGLDPLRVREFVNTKWNIDMKIPLEGIGGHCLPKDLQFMIYMNQHADNLFRAAKMVDEKYKLAISYKQRKKENELRCERWARNYRAMIREHEK